MLSRMENTAIKLDKKDTADIILDAAVKRFSDYGYNKTTMAEIADDCGMSAANIYRYYKNKEEIAAACTKSCMDEKAGVLKGIVRDKDLSAEKKLEKYILATLELSHVAALENQKIEEVCNEITKSKPELIHDKIASNTALLTEILAYGNQTGEFNVDEVMETASAINAMIVVFDVPMFMKLFTKEHFEEKAYSVINFIIKGLKA